MFAIFVNLVQNVLKFSWMFFQLLVLLSNLGNLDIVLKRCVETNLVLNWEKCHFIETEGIVLG